MSDNTRIGDVCSRFSSGKAIASSKISDEGKYPVYGGNGLRGYTDTFNFDGDCAVIGRQGAYCGNVKYFSGKGYMTEHAVVAVANQHNNSRFLAYKFALMDLGRYASQSAQPGLSVETLLNVEIDVPEKAVQDDIARVLATIDEKIENNNSICSNLEAMAKLLYDYWFVQFDFPDKTGKPYKSSGGKMVWNEVLKRPIPAEWQVESIGHIAQVYTDTVFPGPEIEYAHYSIPAFDENKMPTVEYGAEIASNKFLVPKNCILVSKLNPQFKRLWPIIKPMKNGICSTEFLPVVPNNANTAFLYSLLNSDEYSKHLILNASSSTGSRKRIDPDNCLSYTFAYDEKVAALFNDTIKDLFQYVTDIPAENEQLTSLRKFLLPVLMNGQVKVGKEDA